MSHTSYRISTRVLPGSKVEVSAPGLKEGDQVEVIVVVPACQEERQSMSDLVRSLPAGPRSGSSWSDIERALQTT